MELDMNDEAYKILQPYRVVGSTIDNPFRDDILLTTDKVSITIVDSPISPPVGRRPLVAILIVPKDRENDWQYSTHIGLRRVLYQYHNLSRLVVLANVDRGVGRYIRIDYDPIDLSQAQARWESKIKSLLLDVNPVFETHENHVRYALQTVRAVGIKCEEAYIEDIEVDKIEGGLKLIERKRRMRFLASPAILQAECELIVLENGSPTDTSMQYLVTPEYDYIVNTKNLIQVHLQAMVFALSIISEFLNQKMENQITVNALSLGYGAGLLERFLQNQLGFKVVAIDDDKYFCEAIHQFFLSSLDGIGWDGVDINIGWDGVDVKLGFDAIEFVENLVRPEAQTAPDCAQLPKFDIISIDISVHDEQPNPGVCAPPRSFVDSHFLNNTAKVLNGEGALIINCISPDFLFREMLVQKLKASFQRVYEIGIEKEHEFVILATNISSSAPSTSDTMPNAEDGFTRKIKSLVTRAFNITEI